MSRYHLVPLFMGSLVFSSCAASRPESGAEFAEMPSAARSATRVDVDKSEHDAINYGESTGLAGVAAAPMGSDALLVSGPVSRTDDARIKPGPFELVISGVGANNQNFDRGTAEVSASLGYFVSSNFELAARQDVLYSDTGSASWDGSTRLAADYNFGNGALRPVLGVNLGYVYGDSVQDTWEAAPEAGIKFRLSSDVFLQLLAEYQFFFKTARQASDGFDNGQFVYSLGLGFAF